MLQSASVILKIYFCSFGYQFALASDIVQVELSDVFVYCIYCHQISEIHFSNEFLLMKSKKRILYYQTANLGQGITGESWHDYGMMATRVYNLGMGIV